MTEAANAESWRDDETSNLPALRPLIAQSWNRVRRIGLDPNVRLDNRGHADFDPQSQVMAAAAPVLQDLEEKIAGSQYSLLLADRDCRIVYRWFDNPRAEVVFDELGARPGATLLEEDIGTNALGTAFELRRGVTVNGSEHFAHPFKQFSCYGQPITHPLTRRIEGVLDITGIGEVANPLLGPLISRAVADIEHRLVDETKSAEWQLLAAFQAMSSKRSRALAAIGDNVVFSNRAALDLLAPSDYAVMRVLMAGRRPDSELETKLLLANGETVVVTAHRVAGITDGSLFRIERVRQERESVLPAAPPVRMAGGAPVLISGLPGTGRSAKAADVAVHHPLVYLNPTLALLDGESCWANEFRTMMRVRSGTVCVEGVDQLSDVLLRLVMEGVGQPNRPELIFTSGPREELTGLARTLASRCVQRLDLRPLNQRLGEIRQLAERVLQQEVPDSAVRLTAGAVEALAAQTWPGNFHEFVMVLRHAVGGRMTGEIAVTDLPRPYRSTIPERKLGALERAERDAIVRVLGDCDGNKAKAAHILQVSRTTLYSRMRSLRISG